MDEHEQREYKLKPFNIQNGIADGRLKVKPGVLVLNTGSVQLINDECVLEVDGMSLISVRIEDSRRLLLSVVLYDSENKLLVEIVDNEWRTGDILPWDIEAGFQNLIIRQKMGVVNLSINTSKEQVTLNGTFWFNGGVVEIQPAGITYKGNGINGSIAHLCLVCSLIKMNTLTGEVYHAPHSKHGWGCFVSEADIPKRIEMGLEAYNEVISGLMGPSHFKSIIPPTE